MKQKIDNDNDKDSKKTKRKKALRVVSGERQSSDAKVLSVEKQRAMLRYSDIS